MIKTCDYRRNNLIELKHFKNIYITANCYTNYMYIKFLYIYKIFHYDIYNCIYNHLNRN